MNREADGLPECWCVGMRNTECPRHYPEMTPEQRERIKARIMARIQTGGNEMPRILDLAPRSVSPLNWTNATKAQFVAMLNAFAAMLIVFGLKEEAVAAVVIFIDAAFIFFVQLTYERSPSHVRNYLDTAGRPTDGFRDYPRAEYGDYIRRAREP